jgi:hypothetical protein
VDELDLELYCEFVNWCGQGDIKKIGDLENRIISEENFRKLWFEGCQSVTKR